MTALEVPCPACGDVFVIPVQFELSEELIVSSHVDEDGVSLLVAAHEDVCPAVHSGGAA